MKKVKQIVCMAAVISCFFQTSMYGVAAENVSSGTGNMTIEGTVSTEGEYTVIRVNAEDDSNGILLYAIDSDAPEAFGTTNEFTVKKGSEHTVYVKDAAGNITAQTYKVPDANVDLEVNIGYSDTSSAAMITDAEKDAIEKGGGTVAEQVLTDNSNTAERLFFTVTTKDEHVFYLMVDQSRSDNNVYLLDQVTDDDLYALAAGDRDTEEKEANALVFDTDTSVDTTGEKSELEKGAGSASEDWFWWVLLLLLAIAAIYYYKIYKPKQEKMRALSDAKDLDEFEAEDEDIEDDVLDFAVSKEEKEKLLQQIMRTEEPEEEEHLFDEELSYNPEEDFMMEEMMMDSAEQEGGVPELELPETEEDD